MVKSYPIKSIRQALGAKNGAFPIDQLSGVALKLYESFTVRELKHFLKESKKCRMKKSKA